MNLTLTYNGREDLPQSRDSGLCPWDTPRRHAQLLPDTTVVAAKQGDPDGSH
jgi:hypothetical protein